MQICIKHSSGLTEQLQNFTPGIIVLKSQNTLPNLTSILSHIPNELGVCLDMPEYVIGGAIKVNYE